MASESTQFKEGEEHTNWKGGYYYDACGYKRILISKNTYRCEHVLVMEKHLGRNLLADEIVHHKNGVRDDNRLENLELMSRSQHNRLHQTGKKASEETRAKFRRLRKGTNQKESHNQWRSDITKDKVIDVIAQTKTFKEAAKFLNITADALRIRRKYYNLK
jgi:hypothetical protein